MKNRLSVKVCETVCVHDCECAPCLVGVWDEDSTTQLQEYHVSDIIRTD